MKILEQILKDKENRQSLIKQFQELVWNDEKSSEVLSELAYDMDFYEPNDAWRKGDRSYYDDKRLEEEIKDVIRKLEGAKFRE
ncbi:hypothetical protein [Dyadobacter sp. CY343]|uniref:hypothetical protein n=1 Tax=Dyadobacter sp. CY343 TaxID=2907299 RepID=UPI001F35ED14|nr:hypothetical protein [Dyadobacter sp. CY343]MCE7060682.1 hypothetical protein [Dyadobacter sp. CY343]